MHTIETVDCPTMYTSAYWHPAHENTACVDSLSPSLSHKHTHTHTPHWTSARTSITRDYPSCTPESKQPLGRAFEACHLFTCKSLGHSTSHSHTRRRQALPWDEVKFPSFITSISLTIVPCVQLSLVYSTYLQGDLACYTTGPPLQWHHKHTHTHTHKHTHFFFKPCPHAR